MGAVEVPTDEWKCAPCRRRGGRRGRRPGGLYLFNGLPQGGVGGPSTVPTPSPSPAPISFDSHGLGALEAGTYVIDHLDSEAPLRITFVMPAGWEKLMVPGIVWSDGSDATLGFSIVDDLYADPMWGRRPLASDRPADRSDPPRPDLVTALDATPNLNAAASDVTLSGYAGKQVDLTALAPWEPCAAGEAALFATGGDRDLAVPPPDPTDIRRLWILDVDGHRLVISTNTRPAATSTILALTSRPSSIRSGSSSRLRAPPRRLRRADQSGRRG